ncbi:MAG: hypothetical protein N2Z63_07655 [Thiobacillaceae bacterium]|nr:hypothetical protein [Thiobacillaceae bacterium]
MNLADSTARKAPREATRGEIDALEEAFLRNLFYVQGKFPALATYAILLALHQRHGVQTGGGIAC